MLESFVKALGFLGEATRTNLFGLGCPIYCTQPSLASLLLCLLLGFLSGVGLTLYSLWTFCSFGFSPSGSVQPPASSRYSVLSEYLDEHCCRPRRRHPWAHLQLGCFGHHYPWTSRTSLWLAPIHHPPRFFISGFFSGVCGLLLCGWHWSYSHRFCTSSTRASYSWSNCRRLWPLPSGVDWVSSSSFRSTLLWVQGKACLGCWAVGPCCAPGSCIDPKQDPWHWPQDSLLRCGFLQWLGFSYNFQLQCLLLEGRWWRSLPVRFYQPGVPKSDGGKDLLCRSWHRQLRD